MEAFKDGKLHFLRLDRGEDVGSVIVSYAQQAGIRSAALSGIGAVEDVEVGYYDLAGKEYVKQRLEGIYELVSFTGNIARVDGKPFMHAHVVLGSRECSLTGGHFFKGRIAVTGEMFVFEADLPLGRKMNDAVGLKLTARE